MTKFLFIHGWATDSLVWVNNIDAITGGKDFLNINLPGHGGAGRWDEPTLTPAMREMEHWISGLPERSLIGIGWSLGAQALIRYAAEKRLKGLVCVGATPCFVSKDGFPFGQSRALVKRMIDDVRKDPSETVKRFYELNFTKEELTGDEAKRFIERYKYPGPVVCGNGKGKMPPGCYPSFRYDELATALEAIYETDLRGALSGLDVPCLIVHGSADAICPIEAGEYLASHIKGARLEIFKDAGHAPFLTEKDRFNNMVKDFAEKL